MVAWGKLESVTTVVRLHLTEASAARLVVVCVIHIESMFPPIALTHIQPRQCPCRCLLLERLDTAVVALLLACARKPQKNRDTH